MVKNAFSEFLRVAGFDAKMHKVHSTSGIWFSKELWKGISEGIMVSTLMKCDNVIK